MPFVYANARNLSGRGPIPHEIGTADRCLLKYQRPAPADVSVPPPSRLPEKTSVLPRNLAPTRSGDCSRCLQINRRPCCEDFRLDTTTSEASARHAPASRARSRQSPQHPRLERHYGREREPPNNTTRNRPNHGGWIQLRMGKTGPRISQCVDSTEEGTKTTGRYHLGRSCPIPCSHFRTQRNSCRCRGGSRSRCRACFRRSRPNRVGKHTGTHS